MSQEILRQRAKIYARGTTNDDDRKLQRCLEVRDQEKRWLLPEEDVEVLLPAGDIMPFPSTVRWKEWPCRGLISYALQPLPVLTWAALFGRPAAPVGSHESYLILRGIRLALAVPGQVSLSFEDLNEFLPEDEPWSLGRLRTGASVLNVARLSRETQ